MAVPSDIPVARRPEVADRGVAKAPPRPPLSGRPAQTLTPGWYAPCKRAIDVVLAALLLVGTAPLVLFAALLVKLTSRGPVLYSQVRVGRRGRTFRIYKIRTMVHDCERLSGPCWSTAGDPRVTRAGRFLRRTHLDELPQLWNVLKGDMSLVGPRPERPEFVPELEKVIPYYRDRLLVRPGLTGLAQVQLPADTDLTSVRRKLACDLYYVHRVGLLLDLKIMLATASYLARVPFRFTQIVFGVPGSARAEVAYQKLVSDAETVPELQTL